LEFQIKVLTPNTDLNYSERFKKASREYTDESGILGRGSNGDWVGHSLGKKSIKVAGRLRDVSRRQGN